MQFQRATWMFIAAVAAVPAALAWSTTANRHHEAISAEAIAPTAPSEPVAIVEPLVPAPGLAAPHFTPRHDASQSSRKQRQVQDLDLVEPWTGRDLAEELAMVVRPHLEVDRKDPWDPSVLYPSGPTFGEPPTDSSDPWAVTASVETAKAPIARAARPSLDEANPWAASNPL